MSEADPVPAVVTVPWQHPSLDALAAALGITVRTLELWRDRGAPLLGAGPFDELAVRLWHQGKGPGRRPSKRTASLAAPAGEPLLGYLAAVAAVRAAAIPRTGPEDPATQLKREMTIAAQQKNADRRQRFLDRAREHFDALVGRLQRALEREAGGALAASIVEACHGADRLRAEAAVVRLLLAAIDQANGEALRFDQQRRRRRRGIEE